MSKVLIFVEGEPANRRWLLDDVILAAGKAGLEVGRIGAHEPRHAALLDLASVDLAQEVAEGVLSQRANPFGNGPRAVPKGLH